MDSATDKEVFKHRNCCLHAIGTYRFTGAQTTCDSFEAKVYRGRVLFENWAKVFSWFM